MNTRPPRWLDAPRCAGRARQDRARLQALEAEAALAESRPPARPDARGRAARTAAACSPPVDRDLNAYIEFDTRAATCSPPTSNFLETLGYTLDEIVGRAPPHLRRPGRMREHAGLPPASGRDLNAAVPRTTSSSASQGRPEVWIQAVYAPVKDDERQASSRSSRSPPTSPRPSCRRPTASGQLDAIEQGAGGHRVRRWTARC